MLTLTVSTVDSGYSLCWCSQSGIRMLVKGQAALTELLLVVDRQLPRLSSHTLRSRAPAFHAPWWWNRECVLKGNTPSHQCVSVCVCVSLSAVTHRLFWGPGCYVRGGAGNQAGLQEVPWCFGCHGDGICVMSRCCRGRCILLVNRFYCSISCFCSFYRAPAGPGKN